MFAALFSFFRCSDHFLKGWVFSLPFSLVQILTNYVYFSVTSERTEMSGKYLRSIKFSSRKKQQKRVRESINMPNCKIWREVARH